VVSRIEANELWVRDGETGWLFDVGSPDHLATCVLAAVRARERWPGIREENRRTVERKGSVASGFRRVLDIYESMLARSASSRPSPGDDVTP
jgi:glycosyltransferase involved in cell wall biosynthesis